MLRLFTDNWLWLVAIVDLALAIAVTVHAVLWKRDSRAVIAWVGLAWFAPFIGSAAYFCFGVNRIQRTAMSLRIPAARQMPSKGLSIGVEPDPAAPLAHRFPNLTGLAVLGNKITNLPVLPGNRVQPLVDGDEAYPLMLDAIRGARRSVALLSYIFDHDRAGQLFLEALMDAQERGVEVRVLVDDVGSRYSRPNMVREMRRAGLPVASFLPTGLLGFLKHLNMRNHRKILVVDGRIGFTGGTNIREGHWRAFAPGHPAQCLHFSVEGPVVAHLQQVFAADWVFTTGEVLAGDPWFPELDHAGSVWARGIAHGPDEDFEKLVDIIVGALAVARKRVRIVTPYFLPDSSMIKALGVAAMRGVTVEVFLPSRNNIRLVHWAASAQLWQLLEKGCHVFYTEPPFDHTKLMIVDDMWSLIGSTNWDPRSLRLNFEFNVECYDEKLAQDLNGLIDVKQRTARQVTLQEVDSRRFPERLRDGLARLLSPYL